LFRNGEWVGDGYARELQQADGTYRQISLAEWKMAKRLVGSEANREIGQTPAELALVNDLQTLSKQRTQEKKAAQRNGTKPRERPVEEPKRTTEQFPNEAPDAETERVLRFLYG